MLRLLFLAFFPIFSAVTQADNAALLAQLDSAILQRNHFTNQKKDRIAFLINKMKGENDSTSILKLTDDLYKEFYVFQFDSAKAYADKGLALALRQRNDYYRELFTIHHAEILSIGGLYNEAIESIKSLNPSTMRQELLFKYYLTGFSVYSYYSNYCNDKTYAPRYSAQAHQYLQQAVAYADKADPLYEYYMGEYYVYVEPDYLKARKHYMQLLTKVEEGSRAYAMACFALAGNYLNEDNWDKYEEYLIRAAITDLKSCTMENMALQALAIRLFDKGDDQLVSAEQYINLSMEDAKFYNNRLRILEISRILPQIMNAYQTKVEKQNRNLRHSVFFISLLVLALLCTAYFIHRQNGKLTARRHELAENNQQLKNLNQQLADSNHHQSVLNDQLHQLNQKLVDTNKRRESLASIYIDLCAKYIEKLGKYQTLVKRKIKANQAQELLQTISSTRISEEDAATFLNRFDKAFLELYPSFVDDFNALLLEDGRIWLKTPNTLTTELRTFALIRLGVKNTADIAGLLFLSTQTIYNCRSVTKNKAINKDTFDEDVQKLCTVIRE